MKPRRFLIRLNIRERETFIIRSVFRHMETLYQPPIIARDHLRYG